MQAPPLVILQFAPGEAYVIESSVPGGHGGGGEGDGGDGDADGGGGGCGDADGGGDGDADGGGGGEIFVGSHRVVLGAGSHAIFTAFVSPLTSSRLEWQRKSQSSSGLYCSGSSGEYMHGE